MSAAHAAVRAVLADTALTDPTDIAAAAFTKLDADDHAAILLAVLRDVARLEIGRARVRTTSARSPFVEGMRALAAQGVFGMRVFVGGAWKLYGDCDSVELRALGATIGGAEAAEKTRRDGFLYIIAHPNLEGIKIGRAFDPESRLRGYQTGCPNRQYHLVHVSHYLEDCFVAERTVHEALDHYRLSGEWFSAPLQTAMHYIDNQSPFAIHPEEEI